MTNERSTMLSVNNVDILIGKTRIVKHATFQAHAGEIIGLIGPNGAGKTTIMKTILGLTKFTGNITVAGRPVTENDHHALAQVGALIEHPAIYPFLTGLENLKLYCRDNVDLRHVIASLQMEAYINHKATGYSLGMKQKLGIAIALLNRPKLVILDEPMNGLDIEATLGVRKIIKQFAEQGTTFLISSHILGELQKVMTRVVLINSGDIIVNRDIKTFNQISRQTYKIATENNALSLKLLDANNLSAAQNDQYLVVKAEDIYRIQDVLYANDIHLKEISPLDTNFEQIIVNILKKQRGRSHAE